MRIVFPRLYVIMDAALLPRTELELGEELAGAGVELIQYRNKHTSSRHLLETIQELVSKLSGRQARVIVNDRADVAAICGAGGAHVGQEDLKPSEARKLIGAGRLLGVSTHTPGQVCEADAGPADYIAVGPVFGTRSKEKAEPVAGVEFVRTARALTRKPLVAIGGITLERAADVWAAGADAVAVARDILAAERPAGQARRYLELAERGM